MILLPREWSFFFLFAFEYVFNYHLNVDSTEKGYFPPLFLLPLPLLMIFCSSRYGLQIDTIRLDFKSGLEALLKERPIRAIFLGVRIGDPTAVSLLLYHNIYIFVWSAYSLICYSSNPPVRLGYQKNILFESAPGSAEAKFESEVQMWRFAWYI